MKMVEHERAITGVGSFDIHRLILWRVLAFVFLIAMTAYFFLPPDLQREKSVYALFASVFMAAIASFFINQTSIRRSHQIFIQFIFDTLIVGGLIYTTGGFASPFSLFYVILIVALASFLGPIYTIAMAIACSASYLTSVYWFAISHGSVPSFQWTALLLQVSFIFLVGGFMAAISRNRDRLAEETARARMEHTSLHALHRQILREMQEGILMLDQLGVILDHNNAAQSMLARAKLSNLDFPPKVIAYLEQGRQSLMQFEWAHAHGRWLVTLNPLVRSEKEKSWIMSIVDMTEIRSLQDRVAMNDKLATLGRMASLLAHEIRNPLQSLGQAVDLMADGTVGNINELHMIAKEEISRLNRSVSDMLDYAKPLHPETKGVNPRNLLQQSVKQVDFTGEKVIEIYCELDQIHVDAGHFRLVVDNLLRNAVQVSPKKASVSISFKVHSHYVWQMQVMDQGGGIKKEIVDTLFDPFVTGREKGLGLGLATVKQVCEKNDWLLDVVSDDEGACFTVMGN